MDPSPVGYCLVYCYCAQYETLMEKAKQYKSAFCILVGEGFKMGFGRTGET